MEDVARVKNILLIPLRQCLPGLEGAGWYGRADPHIPPAVAKVELAFNEGGVHPSF